MSLKWRPVWLTKGWLALQYSTTFAELRDFTTRDIYRIRELVFNYYALTGWHWCVIDCYHLFHPRSVAKSVHRWSKCRWWTQMYGQIWTNYHGHHSIPMWIGTLYRFKCYYWSYTVSASYFVLMLPNNNWLPLRCRITCPELLWQIRLLLLVRTNSVQHQQLLNCLQGFSPMKQANPRIIPGTHGSFLCYLPIFSGAICSC